MSFFSRLTALAVSCKNRAFRLRQGQIWSRLSPKGRESLSALLSAYPEYADSLWRLADRLSRTDLEWSLDVRRTAGLATVEIRFLDLRGAHIRLLPFSLRHLLANAERAEPAEGVCLYRFYFSKAKDARRVEGRRPFLRRAGK